MSLPGPSETIRAATVVLSIVRAAILLCRAFWFEVLFNRTLLLPLANCFPRRPFIVYVSGIFEADAETACVARDGCHSRCRAW